MLNTNYLIEESEPEALPLSTLSNDIRAAKLKTVKDLDLFKFSSNYQSYAGGMSDLACETGIIIGDTVDCEQ